MNKTELVASVAKKSGLTKKQAEAAVKATFDAVKDSVASGEKVTLIGFGTFSVKKRAAHQGRNPATGAKIKVPASKVISFKAGAGFKSSVK